MAPSNFPHGAVFLSASWLHSSIDEQLFIAETKMAQMAPAHQLSLPLLWPIQQDQMQKESSCQWQQTEHKILRIMLQLVEVKYTDEH